MPAKDPYRLLGVSSGASEDEIRKAYRRAVREHHPDANPDDPRAEENFKEIQHAYEVLSDPKKRREHDERSRPGTSSGRPAGGSVREVVRADLLGKLGNLSYRRTGGSKQFSRELRDEDLARFARLLGLPLDRITRLLGEHAQTRGNVSFGGGRPDASPAEDEKPPVPGKPPKPPKPPKTARPDAGP